MAEDISQMIPGSPRELIVVMKPKIQLPATLGRVESAEHPASSVSGIHDIFVKYNATCSPIFGRTEQHIEAAIAPDLQLSDLADVGLDLTRYYRISVEDNKADNVAKELVNLDEVEAAYVKPATEPPTLNEYVSPLAQEAPAVSPSFVARQGYLNPSPEGVDARWAWTQPGGRGQDIRIIDIEGAWRFTHEDLIKHQGGVVGGIPTQDILWRNHGTAVLGEFSGDQNAKGIVGICDQAIVSAISKFQIGSSVALWQATKRLRPGDIILIELHRPGPRFRCQNRIDQRGYIPIEWWEDDFAAILTATIKGIVVVAAAGNGAENLDDDLYQLRPDGFPVDWTNPFRRSNRDSGAIVVGAGVPPPRTRGKNHGPDRSRLDFSNYGSLIDAQGWGREVTTSGYGDLQGGSDEDYWYTDRFSGTSSAAPIVVGAIGCLQGIARARNGPVLSPADIRKWLRLTGAAQTDAPNRPATQRIGNRPDIKALATPHVELLTPTIDFDSIPVGIETVRAAVFSIKSLVQKATLKVTKWPSEPFGIRYNDTAEFDPVIAKSDQGEIRIWFDFRDEASGETFNESVTITCLQTNKEWKLPITATTIEKLTVATALVLDRSGSMNEDAGLGNGQRRIDVLRPAASVYVDLMDDYDGVGIASFSTDATENLIVTRAGDVPFGSGRLGAKSAIANLTPGGSTSIGDGVAKGFGLIRSTVGYDQRALVVLTDGYENTPLYIADVDDLIQTRVFAIGVGTPDQLNPVALHSLTKKTGGYLMMTGDHKVDTIRLSKYFLQVLAGVENSDIVVDPASRLPDQQGSTTHRLPFQLNASDMSAEAILLLPHENIISFSLETPSGQLIESGSCLQTTDFNHVIGKNVTYWRIGPRAAVESMEAPGKPWHAILRVDEAALRRMDLRDVLYSFVVKTKSNLNMGATLIQDSRKPGANIRICVKFLELGSPLRSEVSVTAHIEVNQEENLLPTFVQVETGHYISEFQWSDVGSYPVHVRAEGQDKHGHPFTREQLQTLFIWWGGDGKPPTGDGHIDPPPSEDV